MGATPDFWYSSMRGMPPPVTSHGAPKTIELVSPAVKQQYSRQSRNDVRQQRTGPGAALLRLLQSVRMAEGL